MTWLPFALGEISVILVTSTIRLFAQCFLGICDLWQGKGNITVVPEDYDGYSDWLVEFDGFP
jgi:hypothetical protein